MTTVEFKYIIYNTLQSPPGWFNETICVKLVRWLIAERFYGVTVSTLDFESSNPSSNLGRTFFF